MTKPLKVTEISSASNGHFKRWRSLDAASGIKKHGEFLVTGEKIIREATELRHIKWKGLIVKTREAQSLLQESWVQDLQVPIFTLPAQLFQELNDSGAPGPILVGEAPPLRESSLSEAPKGLELLLGLQDPVNLGAALRLAEAFEAQVILLKESAYPFLPKCIRAASGSVFRVPLFRGPSVKELSPHPSMVQLDLEGADITQFKWPQNVRLLVGAEGPGVPEHLKGQNCIRIPIKAGMDSLNAVSALSIAVFSYQLSSRR